MSFVEFRNLMIYKIGSPKIFVYLIIWLMVLVFFGTIAQKDYGLYLVQMDYFSSWIKWFGPLPTPSAKLTMLVMFVNLSGFFFRPKIFTLSKLGVTITHVGIMLLLLGSGLTSVFSTEGTMIIDEGKKSNFFENYYVKEFAIIDKSSNEHDNYIIFDEKSLYKNSFLEYSQIPFKIEILDFYPNCNPIQKQSTIIQNNFYKGMARNFYLQEIPPEKDYEKNRAGIIYEIIESGNPQVDGVYILFMGQPIPQTVKADNYEFEFQIRPYRTYLPFEIELVDFDKIMHPGTDVAKSYSSEVNLIEKGVPRKTLIEMNAPLRHYDYTFFQASFIEENNIQTTVLATVKNYGRLFPYISTIVMSFGILFHLLVMVSRRFKF